MLAGVRMRQVQDVRAAISYALSAEDEVSRRKGRCDGGRRVRRLLVSQSALRRPRSTAGRMRRSDAAMGDGRGQACYLLPGTPTLLVLVLALAPARVGIKA